MATPDDLSLYARELTINHNRTAPTHQWVKDSEQWKPLVQSYLASVSFVDQQVGRLLDAIADSPHHDNTYVVLFSDHGWHLGQKERWAKMSQWEASTNVPLIIAGPGIGKGQVCNKPVQLLDIYPTLLDLTGLQNDPKLHGHSVRPMLENAKADWPHLARTCNGPGNYGIYSERYRYIHYNDGSEEFCDHADGPHEWKI